MHRQQHYWFAHRFVPRHREALALRDTDATERARVERTLGALWDQAGQFVGDHATGDELGVATWIERDGIALTTMTFPSPEHPLECYAAVLAAGGDDIRYFVLERGFDAADGSARIYVAEYTRAGVRVRYGDLPTAELQPFVDRVVGLIGFSTSPDPRGPAPTLAPLARQVRPRPPTVAPPAPARWRLWLGVALCAGIVAALTAWVVLL